MKAVTNRFDLCLLLIISLFVFNVRLSSAQNCSLITAQELFVLMQDYYHPSTDEGQPNLFIMDYNITCLSHSTLQDHYQYTTVSVKYLNLLQGFKQNETLAAIIDIGCSTENEWDPDVLGNTAFKWSSPTSNNNPRSDCALCNGDIFGADIATHCVACRDNCSIPGTLQGCYEAGDQQYCCLVYLNGQCSDKCEDNQTVNESFVCERKVEEYSVEPTSTVFSASLSLTTQNVPTSTMPQVSTYSTGNSYPTPVNSKDFPTLIHLSMFLSGITCLVTVIVSISITTTIVVCACCCKCRKRTKSSTHSPVETLSSIGTVSEYVEPLTSPSTNTERSMAIPESLSMHLNSSYSRGSGRYFSATARIPPAQYEDPDLVLYDIKKRSDTSGHKEHSYVTIIA